MRPWTCPWTCPPGRCSGTWTCRRTCPGRSGARPGTSGREAEGDASGAGLDYFIGPPLGAPAAAAPAITSVPAAAAPPTATAPHPIPAVPPPLD
eukprot:scaffold14742_cov114-Isochrysis_galbana.AAC.3